MFIYLKKQFQIKVKAQIEALLFDKALIIFLAKYSNYNNIFSMKNIVKF